MPKNALQSAFFENMISLIFTFFYIAPKKRPVERLFGARMQKSALQSTFLCPIVITAHGTMQSCQPANTTRLLFCFQTFLMTSNYSTIVDSHVNKCKVVGAALPHICLHTTT